MKHNHPHIKQEKHMMKLSTIKEPLELRTKAYELYKSNPHHNMDSFWLWSEHKFPKYLWQEWKDILKNEYNLGYGKFLKILGAKKIELRKWARKEIDWEKFITKLLYSIKNN